MFRCLFIVLLLISCTPKKEPGAPVPIASQNRVSMPVEQVLKTCYACHNPDAPSHDAIIAPPLAGIKRRYLMTYPDSAAFVEALASWAANPDTNRVLMRGAFATFGLMPAQAISDSSLRAAAAYIFSNDIPKPVWFDAHAAGRTMQGPGAGSGRRNGN